MSYLTAMDYASVDVGIQENMYAALATDKKQHFVEWFSGSQLDSIWTFRDIAGTGSGAMSDTENGGYAITTGTSATDSSQIDFNDINHYAHNGSILTGVVSVDSVSLFFHLSGFIETDTDPSNTRISYYLDSTGGPFMRLRTTLNTSSTTVSATVAQDTSPHKFRLELKSSSATMHVDNTLEAISTTNLPDVALQPSIRQGTRTTAAKTGDILYMECYNT